MTVAEPMVVLALGMIILWPFWTFRFVLPLVPFLLCYFIAGVETLASMPARAGLRTPLAPERVVRIFLFVIVGLHVMDHTQYIAQAYGDPRGASWKAHADDIDQVFNWIQKDGTRDGAIAADNPALVYLRTGRRTIAISSTVDKWGRWERMGVRYVVSLSDGELLVDRRATLRFKLGDENIWAFELTGDQSRISMTQNLDRAVPNNTR
jgi:hypothetical protein